MTLHEDEKILFKNDEGRYITERSERSLYVGNIDFRATENDIALFFSQFGKVEMV